MHREFTKQAMATHSQQLVIYMFLSSFFFGPNRKWIHNEVISEVLCVRTLNARDHGDMMHAQK